MPRTEVRLLSDDGDVLNLFAGNPFPQRPPRQVRAVIWQYWFTTMAEKRSQGLWWRREFLGLYAPTLERGAMERSMRSSFRLRGEANESTRKRRRMLDSRGRLSHISLCSLIAEAVP